MAAARPATGPVAPDLESYSAEEVLAYMVEHFHPRLYVACSFQKESSVILDLLMRIEPDARVFTLDTDLLFDETYATRRAVEERYGIEVDDVDVTEENFGSLAGLVRYVESKLAR